MNKNIVLSLMACCSIGVAKAQLSEGGLPWSLGNEKGVKVEALQLPAPDYAAVLEKELEDARNGVAKPYMVSTFVPVDISLENSGTWVYQDDGSAIWRLQVSIPDAKAIDFYYDQFELPEGVRLYISNVDGRQLLGAYTASNNSETGLFSNEAVLGDLAILEMNIPAGVNVNEIRFHINKAGAYYRGVEQLERIYGLTGDDATVKKPTIGESSPCHINSTCSVFGAPESYDIPRNATVHILIVDPNSGGAGFCSGTLLNNTANSEGGNCAPLLLTASHCDGSNYWDDAGFAQWRFYFNYQYDSCDTDLNNNKTQSMTGASFKARSNYPSFPSSNPASSRMVADFLLLELNSPIPSRYGATMAGWNRSNAVMEDPETYNFFIGFHHPAGDVKKVSSGFTIQGNGTFNQTQVPGTHFYIPFREGGSQGGSSGSGLFDVNGLLIGDLSGGTDVTSDTCGAGYGTAGLYSKLSYAWENDFDQTAFPDHAGAASRLKDWLDPIGSGLEMIAPVEANSCVGLSVDQAIKKELEHALEIYPNPSSGRMFAKFNLSQELKDVQVTVVNTLGRVEKQFMLSKVMTGEYEIDGSALANGIYFVNFNAAGTSVGKKIIIAR